jgi:hypothetical protein
MKREFGRGRKILENGISPTAPFPAKAGPTECRLFRLYPVQLSAASSRLKPVKTEGSRQSR